MPGDNWQQFANLRLLLGYQYAQPGKKLLFMGGEFGQWNEWYHETSLDWHLLELDPHRGLQRWVHDLNRFYRAEPALYELDNVGDGFAWIDCNDAESSIVSLRRQGRAAHEQLVIVGNFTPVVGENYRVGVPHGGFWCEVLNSDAEVYGGGQQGNLGGVEASPVAAHGYFHSLTLTVPPLAILFLKSRVITPAEES
jgi:1,4-alpha-glucan branching enzyme